MFVRELGLLIFRSWEWKGKLFVRKEKILLLAFSEDAYYQNQIMDNKIMFVESYCSLWSNWDTISTRLLKKKPIIYYTNKPVVFYLKQ